MARPDKHTVEYFPFYVKDGRTLFILEEKYGCKGTGFFTNVFRFLSSSPDHHFHIADESDEMFFFSKMKCDQESGIDMLNIMAKTGKIEQKLWDKKIIASSDFLSSVEDAYRNRKNTLINILDIYAFYGVSYVRNQVNDVEKPQTKLKETKLEKTKVNKTKTLLSQVDKSTLDEKTKYYFEIAFSFWQLITQNLSELNIKSSAVENADFEKWVSPIRMIIEKDKRTIDEIRSVFQFLRDDDFWRGQIQSTSKLRKKNKDDITYFEYLLIKSKNAGSKKSNSKTGKSNSGVSEDYQNSVFERLLHSPGE